MPAKVLYKQLGISFRVHCSPGGDVKLNEFDVVDILDHCLVCVTTLYNSLELKDFQSQPQALAGELHG